MMTLHRTPLAGEWIVESSRHADARGSFSRIFCEDQLAGVLAGGHLSQANISITLEEGTVRGLHYQVAPHAETKLIRCIRGRIWDVAVDVRRESPTFLKWHGLELSSDNNLMLVVPEGFAHGFQALSSDAHVLYLHTEAHAPTAERGLRFDDPMLGIKWPLPPTCISDRDRAFGLLDAISAGTTA